MTISEFVEVFRKFIWSHHIIYLSFSLLISIQLAIGDELKGSNGAVYKYERIKNRLGEGSFSEAIMGTKLVGQNSERVAMKFRMSHSNKSAHGKLEKDFYHLLSGYPAIPKFHDFLRDKQGNEVLILELLGPTLHTQMKLLGGTFTIKTTMMIGCQLLNIMEYIHSKGVIFRDLTPENLAVGYYNTSNIYIFDFGWSEFYLLNNKHIEPDKVNKGTHFGSYTSVYSHKHKRLSRRDDIESIAYLLIAFLQGKLPWSSLNTNIMVLFKTIMKVEDIVGNKCTKTLVKFLAYARHMKFTDKPDYNYLRQLLLNELYLHGFYEDKIFDWMQMQSLRYRFQHLIG